MGRTKVDYGPIKREYITSDISIRALAAKSGISWSTLNARKNTEEWDARRSEFRTKRDDKTVERLADRAASETDIIRDEMILVLRAAIRKFGADLANGTANVTAADLAKLIPQINLLLGEPTTRTEAQIFGVNLSSQVDPDILRRVVELARGRANSGDGERPTGVVPSLTRAN
jgi:hypothetical protein